MIEARDNISVHYHPQDRENTRGMIESDLYVVFRCYNQIAATQLPIIR